MEQEHVHAGETGNGKKRRRTEDADSQDQRQPQAPQELADPAHYPRKRVSVACEICRIRKTRCDAGRPSCSFCANIGVVCTYRKGGSAVQTLMTRAKQGEKFQTLQSRLESIESVLSSSKILSPDPSEPVAPSLTSSTPRSTSGTETSPIIPSTAPRPEYVSRPSTSHIVQHSSLIRDGPEDAQYPALGLSKALGHLGSLANNQVAPELQALSYDDSEEYIENELHRNDQLYHMADPSMVDLSHPKCWSYQQSFVRHVLPWFPLFGQDDAVRHVNVAQDANFDANLPSTAIALYILALGAFSRAELITGDNPSEFPGLDYFAAGRNISGSNGITSAIEIVQSQILRTSACHRAYWACYIIEKELKPYSSECTPGIEWLNEVVDVPLPLSTHDEPGMLWFLSEIALRRIFSRVSGSELPTSYEPTVVTELHRQIVQWYDTLPPGIKFNLDAQPISDQQKAFLRAQYYAALFITTWSSVVRLLTEKQHAPNEHTILVENSARCFEYGVMYIQTVEASCLERHVLLFANFVGTYVMTMLMLCAFDAPHFAHLQDIGMSIAIQRGHKILSAWATNPNVASKVRRIDVLMREKGLAVRM